MSCYAITGILNKKSNNLKICNIKKNHHNKNEKKPLESQKVIKRLRIIKMFRPKNEETFIQRCLLAVESATADRTVFRSPLRRPVGLKTTRNVLYNTYNGVGVISSKNAKSMHMS